MTITIWVKPAAGVGVVAGVIVGVGLLVPAVGVLATVVGDGAELAPVVLLPLQPASAISATTSTTSRPNQVGTLRCGR